MIDQFNFLWQLERYFQKSAARHEDETRRRRGRASHRGNGDLDDSSLDVSMDNSRASSVEHDVSTLNLNESNAIKKSYSDDEEDSKTMDSDTNAGSSSLGNRPKRRGRKGKISNTSNSSKKNTTVIKLGKCYLSTENRILSS